MPLVRGVFAIWRKLLLWFFPKTAYAMDFQSAEFS
jgi:hypothetical protein